MVSGMKQEAIIERLSSADALPREALRAAMLQTDAIADAVFPLVQKIRQGFLLLPDEEQLFLYGTHVLAAKGSRDLYPVLLELAEHHDYDMRRIFGDHYGYALTRLLISSFDGNDGRVFDLVKNRQLLGELKWALFSIATRRTWEGKIARDAMIGFIRECSHEPFADDDDTAWFCLEDAIVHLGLKELEPLLHQIWQKDAFDTHRQVDRDHALEILEAAVRNPSDETELVRDSLCPIDDPVEALSWVERMAELNAAHADSDSDDDDPAKSIRLSIEERDWLFNFLESKQVPETTMSLEMLDGYFTALVIGPTTIMPSEYMPQVWGEGGEEAKFDCAKQAQYVMGLLMRHWNTIVRRVAADAPIRPIMVPLGDTDRGRAWATGLIAGTALRPNDWEPLFKDEKLGILRRA